MAGKPEDVGIPEPFFSELGKKMLSEAHAMGYGRHTLQEGLLNQIQKWKNDTSFFNIIII